MKNNNRKGPDFQCINCHETVEFKRGSHGKYCSNKCQMDWEWKNVTIPEILQGHGKHRAVKRFLVEQNNRCHECDGEPVWNGKPLVMQLDHLDGNSDNNRLENVRLVCPNCHSQTPNFAYRGMNKSVRKNTKRNTYLRKQSK